MKVKKTIPKMPSSCFIVMLLSLLDGPPEMGVWMTIRAV
jgi:hypothetical protein